MNGLERFGNAVGGALASVAAALGGGNDAPPPRPVPAVIMPETTPLPRPRPDFEVAAAPATGIMTPAPGNAATETPAGAAPGSVASGSVGAAATAAGVDPVAPTVVPAASNALPTVAAPAVGAAAVTAESALGDGAVGAAASLAPPAAASSPAPVAEPNMVVALGVPLPPPRPRDLDASGAAIAEGDAISSGGDLVAAHPVPSTSPSPSVAESTVPAPASAASLAPTPLASGAGTPTSESPAPQAAPGGQFAFAAPETVTNSAPFAAVAAGLSPAAIATPSAPMPGAEATLAPPIAGGAGPLAVRPPGEDHQGGLGATDSVSGDADVGAVVVPLPRPRPETVPGMQVAALHPTPAAPALIARLNRTPPNPACIARLEELGVTFEILEPIATDTGCGSTQPLLVRALADGAVQLDPPATLDCAMAETLVDWVEREVQPAAVEEFAARVTGLHVAASYSCRGVNGATSGPLSEHAYANAIDVSAFEIGSETSVAVLAQDDPETPTAAFLGDVRGAACEHFHTVLGPGSDPSHWNHFHLDLAPRGRNGDSRFCQ